MIRERSLHAEPKVNAKTLRQKDRIRTILRRVRRKGAHQRGNLRSEIYYMIRGNLSGNDGGIVSQQTYCALFWLFFIITPVVLLK